jgi:hypothetical protein
MDFESLIRFKTLQEVYTRANHGFVDHLLKDPKNVEQLGLKKLQFDVSEVVFNNVEAICSMLGMSKREFLESATIAAIEKAQAIMDETSINDVETD